MWHKFGAYAAGYVLCTLLAAMGVLDPYYAAASAVAFAASAPIFSPRAALTVLCFLVSTALVYGPWAAIPLPCLLFPLANAF